MTVGSANCGKQKGFGGHMARKILIKDTTREERIKIVQNALSWGDDCDSVSELSSGVDEMYQPYIDRDRPSTGSCIMGN